MGVFLFLGGVGDFPEGGGGDAHELSEDPGEVVSVGESGLFGDFLQGEWAEMEEVTGLLDSPAPGQVLRGFPSFLAEESDEAVPAQVGHLGQDFILHPFLAMLAQEIADGLDAGVHLGGEEESILGELAETFHQDSQSQKIPPQPVGRVRDEIQKALEFILQGGGHGQDMQAGRPPGVPLPGGEMEIDLMEGGLLPRGEAEISRNQEDLLRSHGIAYPVDLQVGSGDFVPVEAPIGG